MAKKKIICDTDVMIEYWDTTKSRHAATALIADLELYTYNIKDFKFISRLRLYTP